MLLTGCVVAIRGSSNLPILVILKIPSENSLGMRGIPYRQISNGMRGIPYHKPITNHHSFDEFH